MMTNGKCQSSDFMVYCNVELKYIDDAKYYEGIKIGHDPGEQWIVEYWIPNHALEFRNNWTSSCCKNCKKVLECGKKLKDVCDNFI